MRRSRRPSLLTSAQSRAPEPMNDSAAKDWMVTLGAVLSPASGGRKGNADRERKHSITALAAEHYLIVSRKKYAQRRSS